MEHYFKPKTYRGILVTLEDDEVRVFDEKTKREIKPKLLHGQLGFPLYKKGKLNRNLIYLHEISADTFLPPSTPDKKYIRFINGNRRDCHPRNLYNDSEPSDNCIPVPVKEFARFYRISPNKEVWSERLRAFMSPSLGSKDYPSIWMYGVDGKNSWHQCHRLVGLAFVHNPDPLRFNVCHHLDNDPTNFAASNLKWVSQSRNVKEGWNSGRAKKTGAKSPWFIGIYEINGFVAESVREIVDHLKITPYKAQKMIDEGVVSFTPKDRLAERSDLPAKILDSLNSRTKTKSNK